MRIVQTVDRVDPVDLSFLRTALGLLDQRSEVRAALLAAIAAFDRGAGVVVVSTESDPGGD